MPESGNLLSQIDTASAAKNPLKALADILKDKDLSPDDKRVLLN